MTSASPFKLCRVRDVIGDLVELNNDTSTGKASRWVLIAGSLKNHQDDRVEYLRFRLQSDRNRSEQYDFIVRQIAGVFYVRSDYWDETVAEDECDVFFSPAGSAILVYEDDLQALYLYMDAREQE